MKQTPEGKVDRYKARLVAKGDLQEEVYMEIPPGFTSIETNGKSNADHTMFFCHNKGKVAILIVYVDDIILTDDDLSELARLKTQLAQSFEVKDLDNLRYFSEIEVARSSHAIFLSQRKYILDLLTETEILRCRSAVTPIEQNHRLTTDSGKSVDRERYQHLVGKLIYLSHTRPDIAFTINVVSQYMHDSRESHQETVYRIFRYLKGCPGRDLFFSHHKHLNVEAYSDADWAGSIDNRRSISSYCIFIGGNLVTWRSKKQDIVARSSAEAEYRAMAQGICEVIWLK
uniref:Uncharacterized protein LOC109506028 n=1 Tax=Elaeis guineensis var. tenera TaxID=51953 RepID=A0A6J0PLH1_ELAGV|nr:uncharacterized protein LOC109506028 [Elaeis guineensis]